LRAALSETGAASGAYYAAIADARWRTLVTEGLFPPPQPWQEPIAAKVPTRAQRLAWVLGPHELARGEGVIGAVALSGRGEWIPVAQDDRRVIAHGDPAWIARSLLVLPVPIDESRRDVVAVANPMSGNAFTADEWSRLDQLVARFGGFVA
jgi:hypothetical protein